jgi:hypothetical protein
MQLSNSSVSPPTREYEIAFIKFGNLRRPASRARAVVLASDSEAAKRILRLAVKRIGDIRIIRSRPLLAAER